MCVSFRRGGQSVRLTALCTGGYTVGCAPSRIRACSCLDTIRRLQTCLFGKSSGARVMNVSSVRLFLEVAEAGSLNKVAARRQTVQSHVSRQITDFEAECGGRLFRRTGRGVALTEFGLRAVARLRPWLQETEQLSQELRSESGQLLGEVRLGIIPSAAHPLTTRLFERLQADHPGHPARHRGSAGRGARRDAGQRRGRPGGAVPLPPAERRARSGCCASRTPTSSRPPATNSPASRR